MKNLPLHVSVTQRAGILLVAVAMLTPWTPDVAAQEPPDSVIPLEPLEVTVLRTPFLQNAAPVSVSAMMGSDLHRGRAGFFLEEALQGLPGVQVQNRFNPSQGERVLIRGFGARAQHGLRGIRVVVDGIPGTLPDGQSGLDHLDIGSLGRVEAIRGPASSLFGNASGGVLFFTTRDPSSSPYDLEVMGVTGSDGLRRAHLTASGTVNDTGYLITVSDQTWDGYRTIASGSARIDTLGSKYGGADRLGVNARVTTPLSGGELSFTANVLALDAENAGSKKDGTDAFSEINDIYLRFRTAEKIEQQQVGVRWTGALGEGLEADFSVYGVHRTVDATIPFDIIDLSRKGGGLRAHLVNTISTSFGELQWLGGFEFDLQSDDRTETELSFGSGQPVPGAGPLLDQAEDVQSKSLFLQATLELPGGAVVLAGLRSDSHDFTVDDRVPITAENSDDSGSREMNGFSPSIGISVPAGAINVFGAFGTVFSTPTTSELGNQPDAPGGFNPDLDPMRGESFEVGIRGKVGSLAAFEVTGYQTNLRKELVRFEVEDFVDITYFKNSGKSRHRGLEATLSIASGDGLFRGDVTYTHTNARFLKFEDDDNDYANNRIPGVAPNRARARLRVSPDLWWAEVTTSYMGSIDADNANTGAAPSYTLVDLRVGLEEVAVGGINVTPWAAVINVRNEEYIASVAVNARGRRFLEPGPDRSFQIGLRTRFGGGN